MNKNYFFVLFLVGVVFLFNNPSPEQPVAVIFDSLDPSSVPELSQVLHDSGFKVITYTSKDVTVTNLKNIPPEPDLVIVRVHSSINQDKIWLFTGELFKNEKYPVDQLVNSVHMARTNSTGEYYFAVCSNFFREYSPDLDGAIILVMGCDAAASNELSEVFLAKGASSYTSWDGPVSLEHTDKVFNNIVSSFTEGMDIETAVNLAMEKHGVDPYFNSTLICFK